MAPQPPSFVRPTVRDMDGYTPGEQPGPGERVVKLNTNENPVPPSPNVMRAIREIEPEMLRRYPNPTADMFREAAAKVLGITPDMIIAARRSADSETTFMVLNSGCLCIRCREVIGLLQGNYEVAKGFVRREFGIRTIKGLRRAPGAGHQGP